ncbi:MAG: hypothetical protein JRD47_04420 [Deltaproteobacteria bacterium]|nr:hypothetical protein [Deltaproteobacteria bacterium]MBW2601160.1 hypothetical protein [Deltaproteobacteria bacterium]
MGGIVGKERKDEFLEKIDKELYLLNKKVKKVVSKAETVLKEYQKDAQDGDQGEVGQK